MLLAGALCATGFAAPVQCPPHLTVRQTAADAPAEMRVIDIAPKHAWTNAQFSDGPPDQEAWLAPDTSVRHGKATTNTWIMSPSPAGLWVSCTYDGTSLALSFRLPDTIRRCEIRYDDTVSPPVARSVDCR